MEIETHSGVKMFKSITEMEVVDNINQWSEENRINITSICLEFNEKEVTAFVVYKVKDNLHSPIKVY